VSTLRRLTRRRRPWWLILGPTAAVVALIVIVLGVAIAGITASLGAHASGLTGGRTSSSDCPGTPGGQPVPVTGSAPGLTAEQLSNAQAIAGVALGLGIGERGVQIGIVAALTESTLRNLNFGDYNSNGVMTTSRGMFQMKEAWGSLADRLDPTRAATIFYTIDKGPGVRGLLHIPGWQQMTVTQAAQAVEGSQFADGSNYLANLARAQVITTSLLAGQPLARISAQLVGARA